MRRRTAPRAPLLADRWDALAVAAIIVGLGIRGLWLLIHPPADYIFSDMATYVTRGQKLASGGDLNPYDAFQPPGPPMLLFLPLKLFGTGRTGLDAGATVWWALSSATPFFMWRFARIFFGTAAAALTAALCAVWPLHFTYAGYFLSETPALAFLAAGLWLGYGSERLSGRRALAVGLVGGLCGGFALANRPQFLLNVALVVLPFLPRRARNVRATVAFVAGAAVVVAGVVSFNSIAAGRLTGLAESGGVTFFIGQCDVRTVHVKTPGTQYTIGPPPALQRGSGHEYTFADRQIWEDRFFYRQGLNCIRHDGLDHLTLVAQSLADLTATTVPWPQVTERHLRHVVTTANFLYSLVLPVIIFGTILSIRRRRGDYGRGQVILLAQLACVVPIAILFLGDPRFRAPYDAFGLALLASLVAPRLLARATRSR